jgi:hypothetical protein
MEYRVLDISKDPTEQGFKDSDYDLIVASNTIHATRSLSESLLNVRKLLAPNGRLLLQELYTHSKWINCVLGFLPDWWCGEDDGRVDEPYVGPGRWQDELERAGFDRPHVVVDAEEPHQLNAVMIAKPKGASLKPINSQVTILYDQQGENVTALSQKLQSRGYTVQLCTFGDELPEHQDIISVLDDDSPFFQVVNEHRFKAFQRLLAHLGNSECGLFWVTRPSQVQCKDPLYAQILGAARSARNEDLVDFATCEVDNMAMSLDAVIDTFMHFQKRQEDESLRPDYEYAITKGTINVPRIYPFQYTEEASPESDGEYRMSLAAEKPGRLSSLRWQSKSIQTLVGDQVEIKVFAAGVSLKVRDPLEV